MSDIKERIHTITGFWVWKYIPIAIAIEAAFLIEPYKDKLNWLKQYLPEGASPHLDSLLGTPHLVTALGTLAYAVILFLYAAIHRLFGEERVFRGTYLSLPDANAAHVSIFRITTGFFSTNHRLDGNRYELSSPASPSPSGVAARPRLTGGWRADVLDSRPGQPSKIDYIYAGEVSGKFSGRGFTAMTLREDGTGEGYWLDDEPNAASSNTKYFKVTRSLRRILLGDAGWFAQCSAWLPWSEGSLLEAYARLSESHPLRQRPARLP